MKSPISSVYGFTFAGDHAVEVDLSDRRVNEKHLENSIPMAILHWMRHRPLDDLAKMRIVMRQIWKREAQAILLQRSLFNSSRVAIEVICEGSAMKLTPPVDFPVQWRQAIESQQPTVLQIEAILRENGIERPDSMQFYQNVSNREKDVVQGRIHGLKVLELNLKKSKKSRQVTVGVGQPGKALGLKLAQMNLTGKQLVQYVTDNRSKPNGDLGLFEEDEEHYLESKVLGGLGANVEILKHLQFILPGSVFFQFPTVTETDGHSRYIDILARQDTTPWAIEIKVARTPAKEGEYYFQALGQALSYAGFLKCAHGLEFLKADFTNTRPVTLFPQFTEDHQGLQKDFEKLIQALNQLLLPNNNAQAFYVDREQWQKHRTVAMIEAGAA